MATRVSRGQADTLLGHNSLDKGVSFLPKSLAPPNIPRTPRQAGGAADYLVLPEKSTDFPSPACPLPSSSTSLPTHPQRALHLGDRTGLTVPCLILVPPPLRGSAGLEDWGKMPPFSRPPYRTQLPIRGRGLGLLWANSNQGHLGDRSPNQFMCVPQALLRPCS